MKKTYIFIDGSNFYHALKAEFKDTSLDFYKLGKNLCVELKNKFGEDYDLGRIFYYIAALNQKIDPKAYKDQQRFFISLRNTPFLTLRLGRLEMRRGGQVEKGIDVQIAVDMMDMALSNLYDAAILISGDGDFAPVLETIKKRCKSQVFTALPSTQCYHLKTEADHFILIDQKIFQASK